MPAVVLDTSCPPLRMPLDPHVSSPRDLSRGLTLTPKSRGVWKWGDRAAFEYAEQGAFPGSVIPRYVCGVGPCPHFLGHQCDLLWGAGRGIGGLAQQEAVC